MARSKAAPGPPRSVTVARALAVLLAAGLWLAATSAVQAADFQAGAAVAERGDYDAARAQWQPQAEQGDMRAQYRLGLLYTDDRVPWAAPAVAAYWFAAAAEQGYASAQYKLALMQQTGDGVSADLATAAQWYEKAAAQGLAAAQYKLGLMYMQGEGVRRDPVAAIGWLGRAVAQSSEAARAARQRLIDELPGAAVDRPAVNMRAAPTMTAAVRARPKADAPARILAQNNGWSRVWLTDSDRIGWIASHLLRDIPRAPEPPPPAAPADRPQTTTAPGAADMPAAAPDSVAPSDRSMRVATPLLDVHEWPAVQAPVITRLEYDAVVEVVARSGDWRRIRLPTGDGTGWVAGHLLRAR